MAVSGKPKIPSKDNLPKLGYPNQWNWIPLDPQVDAINKLAVKYMGRPLVERRILPDGQQKYHMAPQDAAVMKRIMADDHPYKKFFN